MLTVEQAWAEIVAHSRPLGARSVPLARSLGMLLAEAITSDIDSPPYDKSLMDGYAVQHKDLADGKAELRVVEEITAGSTPQLAVGEGEAARIMTGAPLPEGATAVVMIEHIEMLPGDPPRVRLQTPAPKKGQNILRKAACMQTGEEVLPAGHKVRPGDIGLMAEAGMSRVMIYPAPRVVVQATGNELVAPGDPLKPGCIRNSNGPMLLAMAAAVGADEHDMGIAKDDRAALRSKIVAGLQSHILVLSGGVSAGVLDLPGNPVSSFVCFHLFVKLAIARLAGSTAESPARLEARLAAPFRHQGERPTWQPAELWDADGGRHCRPVQWQGSADLRSLAKAQCLAHFPAGDHQYKTGDTVEVLPF